MTTERWRQVEATFHGALEQPEIERGGWLVAACADDRELFCEVQSLLLADSVGDFGFEREIRRTAAMLLLTFGLPRPTSGSA